MSVATEKQAVLALIWAYFDEHVPPETRSTYVQEVFAKRRKRYERMSLATLRENLAKLERGHRKKETSTTMRLRRRGIFEIEWPVGFLVTAKVLEDTMSRYWNLPVQVREVTAAPGQVVVNGEPVDVVDESGGRCTFVEPHPFQEGEGECQKLGQ